MSAFCAFESGLLYSNHLELIYLMAGQVMTDVAVVTLKNAPVALVEEGLVRVLLKLRVSF